MALNPFPYLASILARRTKEPNYPDVGVSRTISWPSPNMRADEITAFKRSAFFAAHRYMTQTVGQLPVRVMRMRGADSERAATHPVDAIMNWRPNPELSPFQLKETLVGWAIVYGNGVAEIERDRVGRVIALWPIHPDRVSFHRDISSDALVYRITNGTSGSVDLEPASVFHLRGYGDGPVGKGVVAHAAESLGWSQAVETFGAAFFGNGLNPSGVIEGAPSDPDAQKRLLAQAASRHGGAAKAHKPLLLDKTMKWVSTSTKPNDAQFIETMNFQVEEICRWMGVPPHKVAHLLRSTFSNIEHQAIEVVVDSVTPWAIRFEEECNYKLFGQNRSGFFVKLDLKGLLRGDFKSRQEGLQLQRRNGVINAIEWRELEDMGPMDSAAGGKYVVESNMTTLEQVGEIPEPVAPPPPPPPPPDTTDTEDMPDAGQMARIATRLAQARVMLNAA